MYIINVPKYLSNELKNLVLGSYKSNNINFHDLCKNEVILLDEILFSNVVFKLAHYNLISKILNISLDELLCDVDVKVQNETNLNLKERERIHTILSFFAEVSYLKRMTS